ncbi:Putative glycosyltransferase EpsE [Variovorax sp. SRS16]|uniref:glycosyltransferase n=1 Tax=Variovorax sp. SRS16 TaxID=282217 RepID=UPI00131810C0|nr:glycosyltransferase [Variovorax sp. SRS16]VTU34021.1 Putative glycosyltransferase EpsE [Variovorax sp. SRS16]
MTAAAGFDVLMCTHRLNAELRRALASCFDQTLKPGSLVLVVNGLQIGDAEQAYLDDLVRTWPALRVLTTPVRGLIFSLNLGLHACRAPLVARMDADDLALPHRFERQVAWMQSHPETTILGTWYDHVDARGQVTRSLQLPIEDARIRRALFWGNPLCHPSVMYRRQAILDLGGYHGGLHAEDYDLWLRASRRPDCGFANLPEVCLHYSAASTGDARGSRQAYASVLASQARQLVTGGGLLWAPALLWTLAKLLFRSA